MLTLCALLIVGLFFWIPPLVNRFTGSGTSPAYVSTVLPPGATPLDNGSAPVSPRVKPEADPTTGTFSWQNVDEFIASDPLVHSAEVAAIQSNPFRIDEDQFPPPVLFAKDVGTTDAAHPNRRTTQVRPTGDLHLKSTIVGVKRRAAYINSKLYFEGADFNVKGVQYRLAAVHQRKVILRRGSALIELKIPEALSLEANQ